MGYRYRGVLLYVNVGDLEQVFPEYKGMVHMRLGELHRSDACGS
jgi:hypothetical protein